MMNKHTKLISVSKTRQKPLFSLLRIFFFALKMKNIFLIRGLEVETTAHDSEHKGHTHNTRFTRWNPIPTLVQMAFIFYKVHDTLQIFNDAISIGLLCQTP